MGGQIQQLRCFDKIQKKQKRHVRSRDGREGRGLLPVPTLPTRNEIALLITQTLHAVSSGRVGNPETFCDV